MSERKYTETWTGTFPLRDTLGPAATTEGPRAPLSPFPDRIGPYLAEELIGRGGMAAVYRCRDAHGEAVAIKWLHQPSPALTQRFALEIRSLARLDHPGVVRYIGHGEHNGRPYLVMEYLDGEDLRLWAHRLRGLAPIERHARVRKLAIRLASALAYVHASGLVHRDVKPSNVRVIQDDVPVLTDFGVVKDLADHGETLAGVVVGTLHYAAPEQIRGDPVDARTDLYGLGCTLYTVIVDRRPFEGGNRATLMQAHLESLPTPLSVHEPTIPADLDHVVLRLMAKRPEDRPSDAGEVVRILSATAPEQGVPLTGRQAALDLVARALERVAEGRTTLVSVSGPPGSGRRWLLRTMGESALRRGLRFIMVKDRAALDQAQEWVASAPILVAASFDLKEANLHIRLHPLGPADVRRSVVASSRDVAEPAVLAERLFRATGGLPALLVPLLRSLQHDPHALDGPLPSISVERWLDDLDLESLEILQVLAAARQPLNIPALEKIARVPAEDPVTELIRRGLVREVSNGTTPTPEAQVSRFVVSAGIFADAALNLVPDPDELRRRLTTELGSDEPVLESTSSSDDWQARFSSAMAARDESRWTEAGSAFESLSLEAEQDQDNVRVARVTIGLGTVDWALGKPKSAEFSLHRALELAPDDLQTQGNACNGLGILEVQAGRPASALELFDRAAKAFQEARLPAREVAAWLNLAEARSMVGQLAGALEASERAVTLSQALALPPLECASLRHKGLVLLDVGLAEEAGRALADATALAHAARLPSERFAAHVLRAQSGLDASPGARMAAAAAADRLIRVLGDAVTADPEGHRALAQGLLARAAAILGDTRMFQKALDKANAAEAERISPVWIRILLQLTRAMWTAGQRPQALRQLEQARATAQTQGFMLLAWEADRIHAKLMSKPLPPPGELARGLSARSEAALSRKPAFP